MQYFLKKTMYMGRPIRSYRSGPGGPLLHISLPFPVYLSCQSNKGKADEKIILKKQNIYNV